ncbi:hypothetical protein ACFPQ4_01370 [Cohnella yongneupensis]|uniref:Uncharacterized protein n=1 Tax=Cohnella yongneupensis TaxID=425006 RepID=A0ABW0QT02_9BACL
MKKRAHAPKSIEINGVSDWLADPDPIPLDHLLEIEAYRTLRRESPSYLAFIAELLSCITMMALNKAKSPKLSTSLSVR